MSATLVGPARQTPQAQCVWGSLGDHERGWPPGGDLREGREGPQARGSFCVAPLRVDTYSPLRNESRIFWRLPDKYVTQRGVSNP